MIHAFIVLKLEVKLNLKFLLGDTAYGFLVYSKYKFEVKHLKQTNVRHK